MVHISRSEPDKVTVEYTPEELSAVENDLLLYSVGLDEPASQATENFLLAVERYRLQLEPRMATGND